MNLGNIWTNYNESNAKKNNIIYKKPNNFNNIKKNKQINNSSINIRQNVFNNIFSSKTGQNKAHQVLNSENNIINGFSVVNDTRDSKTYWGTPTWFMFHSIAAKVNEKYYSENYEKIWNFIKETCSILPCPYCRHHAVQYVIKISINQINTKEKLIQVLFDFHNSVNQQSYKKLYLKKDLSKYKNADMTKIFNLFQSRFFKSYFLTREFQDWNKNKFKEKFTKFVSETKDYFD